MTNPLLDDWNTPFDIAPFGRISDDDFAPALDIALTEARAEITAIADDPAAPTFANTLEALEASGKVLSRVLSTFFTVAGADSNPARQALQRAFAPKLAAHGSWVYAQKALFARIEALWDARDALDLRGRDGSRIRAAMIQRHEFVRIGRLIKPVVHPPSVFTKNGTS